MFKGSFCVLVYHSPYFGSEPERAELDWIQIVYFQDDPRKQEGESSKEGKADGLGFWGFLPGTLLSITPLACWNFLLEEQEAGELSH
jgi:hypothetical protein